jgi:hypothetical protein
LLRAVRPDPIDRSRTRRQHHVNLVEKYQTDSDNSAVDANRYGEPRHAVFQQYQKTCAGTVTLCCAACLVFPRGAWVGPGQSHALRIDRSQASLLHCLLSSVAHTGNTAPGATMDLEHRWSTRKNIRLDVSLHYPPVGVIRGRTRNISLEGMFVDLDGAAVPSQARVEIRFRAHPHGTDFEYRLPAYVVHSGNRGIGVMLQHSGYREFDALSQMLLSD